MKFVQNLTGFQKICGFTPFRQTDLTSQLVIVYLLVGDFEKSCK